MWREGCDCQRDALCCASAERSPCGQAAPQNRYRQIKGLWRRQRETNISQSPNMRLRTWPRVLFCFFVFCAPCFLVMVEVSSLQITSDCRASASIIKHMQTIIRGICTLYDLQRACGSAVLHGGGGWCRFMGRNNWCHGVHMCTFNRSLLYSRGALIV